MEHQQPQQHRAQFTPLVSANGQHQGLLELSYAAAHATVAPASASSSYGGHQPVGATPYGLFTYPNTAPRPPLQPLRLDQHRQHAPVASHHTPGIVYTHADWQYAHAPQPGSAHAACDHDDDLPSAADVFSAPRQQEPPRLKAPPPTIEPSDGDLGDGNAKSPPAKTVEDPEPDELLALRAKLDEVCLKYPEIGETKSKHSNFTSPQRYKTLARNGTKLESKTSRDDRKHLDKRIATLVAKHSKERQRKKLVLLERKATAAAAALVDEQCKVSSEDVAVVPKAGKAGKKRGRGESTAPVEPTKADSKGAVKPGPAAALKAQLQLDKSTLASEKAEGKEALADPATHLAIIELLVKDFEGYEKKQDAWYIKVARKLFDKPGYATAIKGVVHTKLRIYRRIRRKERHVPTGNTGEMGVDGEQVDDDVATPELDKLTDEEEAFKDSGLYELLYNALSENPRFEPEEQRTSVDDGGSDPWVDESDDDDASDVDYDGVVKKASDKPHVKKQRRSADDVTEAKLELENRKLALLEQGQAGKEVMTSAIQSMAGSFTSRGQRELARDAADIEHRRTVAANDEKAASFARAAKFYDIAQAGGNPALIATALEKLEKLC